MEKSRVSNPARKGKVKPKSDFALENPPDDELLDEVEYREGDGGEVLTDDEFSGLPFQMRNRHNNYPWDIWLDGKPRRIRRTHEDEDGVRHVGQFECTVKSMNVAIRREAGRRSLRCSVFNESENSIVFRTHPQNSPDE